MFFFYLLQTYDATSNAMRKWPFKRGRLACKKGGGEGQIGV
jgi:hypothetical protein